MGQTRRQWLGALGAVLASAAVPALAQPRARYRIAYLGNSSPKLEADLVASFRQGLKDLQYREGRDFVIDFRWAQGRYERFPGLVAELIALRPDVIITAGTPGALAAKQATQTVPIVMAVIADPVSVGVVPSLARPGSNLTGSASMLHELAGKRIELLRELLPGISRVAAIWNPSNPANKSLLQQMLAAARGVKLSVEPLVSGESDAKLAEGFKAIVAARAKAVLVEPDRALLARRAAIIEFAAKQQLPAVYPYREFVEAGGLAAYAPDFRAMFRRAAQYVDKIFKGAKPGDLPVEQPDKFELTLNLRTAAALRLAIPRELQLRADRMIE